MRLGCGWQTIVCSLGAAEFHNRFCCVSLETHGSLPSRAIPVQGGETDAKRVVSIDLNCQAASIRPKGRTGVALCT